MIARKTAFEKMIEKVQNAESHSISPVWWRSGKWAIVIEATWKKKLANDRLVNLRIALQDSPNSFLELGKLLKMSLDVGCQAQARPVLRAQRYRKCSDEAEYHKNGKAGAAQLQFSVLCCSINFVVIEKVNKNLRLIKVIHLHLPVFY